MRLFRRRRQPRVRLTLAVRRALGVDSPKQAAAMAEAWRPYRAYALFHLWTSATYL